MKLAIYLRKSRAEEQADLKETLRRHKETLLAFADARHFKIEEVFEEVASGESLFARPQMMALLRRVEAETYDAVLCMDIDRLGRGGMRDQGIILDTFKYSGTQIITPEKTYDLNDEMDEELTEFKTFLSRREYKIINKRLQRGLRQTILDGGYVANAPYGYKKTVVGRKPTLVVEEEEAAFVRMIFRLYVEEGLGTSAIADLLHAMGATPRRAEHFCRTSVGIILKNPVYTGKIVWNRHKLIRKGTHGNDTHSIQRQPMEKWLVAQGLHSPIVEESCFERAQQIMKSRAHPPAQAGIIKNPLAGLVSCAVCGKTMQRRGGKGIPYLLCPTPGCVAGAKASAVEEALMCGLRPILEKIRWKAGGSQGKPSLGMSIAEAAHKEYNALRVQRKKLHELFERGVYDEVTFCERRRELDIRIQEAESARNRRYAEIEGAQSVSLNAFQIYCQSNPGDRNALLRSVIDHIEYDKVKKSAPADFTLVLYLRPFHTGEGEKASIRE